MKEKKKIPWGLIYVGLTVVVMIVFGLVNTEFAGMFSVIANLSLGFVALAVLMTGVFLVTEGGIIHMLLRAQGEHVGFWTTVKIGLIGIIILTSRRAPRAGSLRRSSTCGAIRSRSATPLRCCL